MVTIGQGEHRKTNAATASKDCKAEIFFFFIFMFRHQLHGFLYEDLRVGTPSTVKL